MKLEQISPINSFFPKFILKILFQISNEMGKTQMLFENRSIVDKN